MPDKSFYTSSLQERLGPLVELHIVKKSYIGTNGVLQEQRGRELKQLGSSSLCLILKDFVVYQMDVKSDFLYGKIKEEVYVCQPPEFEDPDFPDREEDMCTELRDDAMNVPDEFCGRAYIFSLDSKNNMETLTGLCSKDANGERFYVRVHRFQGQSKAFTSSCCEKGSL
ncbi:putative ribonuclease H-like domain-containing protein [Tanacetum coccineum]